MVFTILTLASCEPESNVVIPTFSDITITPQQSVYTVGDTITCFITRLTEGSEGLLEDANQYWFYASWWFKDPTLTADFQVFEKTEEGIAVKIPYLLIGTNPLAISFELEK